MGFNRFCQFLNVNSWIHQRTQLPENADKIRGVAPDCLDSIGELAAPILMNRGSTKRFTLDLLKPSPCPYICMYRYSVFQCQDGSTARCSGSAEPAAKNAAQLHSGGSKEMSRPMPFGVNFGPLLSEKHFRRLVLVFHNADLWKEIQLLNISAFFVYPKNRANIHVHF